MAVDPSREELEEAAPGPLKIVMNAAELGFLDESFAAVTSFYTLMYVNDCESLRNIFREAYRVLQKNGRFMIWDSIIPPRESGEKDVAVFQLALRLGEETIETGYGTLWPEAGRDASVYQDEAVRAGFRVISHPEAKHRLYLELEKS